ncbi:MAG: hypothetical protein RR685_02355 [Hungatella sp.]
MSEVQNLTEGDQTCPAVGYQSASICVPVTVTPFAKTGVTFTKCCGNPVVVPGRNTCEGVKNGACAFTISQDICVAVPIEFGAVATVGDTFVHCNGASADDICSDCKKIAKSNLPELPTER